MIDIHSETTQFSFLAIYYQVIKSGVNTENEKRKKKYPRIEQLMQLKNHCY